MIKSFKLFESHRQIESICKKYRIKDWRLNTETGLVDVTGYVNFHGMGLRRIPIKFGSVSDNFYCHNNQLTSLEGSPQSVGGYFRCSYNQLTSLEGSPKSVGGDFLCSYNQLTSLEGSPKSVGGDFLCTDSQLTSLEGAPQSVGGYFGCRNNKIRDFLVPYASLNESRKFLCEENPIFEIYQLFNDPKCIDIINEWGILDGKKIVRIRLEEVFLDMGLEVPERLKFKEWELV